MKPILLFLCLIPPFIAAQNPDSAAYQLSRETPTFSLIDNAFSQIYEDPTFLIPLDSLLQLPQKYRFEKHQIEELSALKPTSLWVYFKVKNSDSVSFQRFVMLQQRNIERAQLFVVDENGRVDSSRVLGCDFPFGRQAIPTQIVSFTVNFEAGKTYKFYLHIEQHDQPLRTEIKLTRTEDALPLLEIRWYAFVVGLGFIYVCLAFGMFLFMKKPLYLAYLIYTIGGVGYIAATKGIGYEAIWSNFTIFEGISETVFGTTALIGFLLFTIYFFETPQYFPIFDKILKGVIAICTLIILTGFFRKMLPQGTYLTTAIVGLVAAFITLPIVPIIAISSYYLLKKKEALYFIIGFSSFIVSAVLNIAVEMGFNGLRHLAHNLLPPFTTLFEFSILLFLLGYRIKEEWLKQTLQELEFQKNLSAQRLRISRDLHDDVGSTLTSIALFSEIAIRQVQATNPAAVPNLERIGEASRHLIDSVNDIVWSVNPQNDKFENIILRMRLFAADLMMPKNVAINFEADERLNALNLSVEKRKHFYLIYKEAINNVFKYAECSTLNIQIALSECEITLFIQDNGKGFDPQNPQIGNGLKSMSDRAEILRGGIVIDSMAAKGTTIKLHFPIEDLKINADKK